MFGFKITLLLLLFCPSLVTAQLSVFVSVLPHKMILERIAGEHVRVRVMVEKGFDPAIYQPTPRQIGALADADLYLRAGVPFEDSWLPRFQSVNPRLQMLDLRDGIELVQIAGDIHAKEHQDNLLDPHVWTDPLLLQRQAAKVRDLLRQRLPEHADEFNLNYQHLSQDFNKLDQEIRRLLAATQQRRFLVFHPAWGYFARRYGWQQLAVEHNGKEPNARELARLIEQAKQLGIDKVIVQPQNHSKTARTLADAIQGELLMADPLTEDYFLGLRDFAGILGQAYR